MKIVFAVTALAVFAVTVFARTSLTADPFTRFVDATGNISIPKNFRSWYFLGTWAVATEEDDEVGAMGLHNVYTQPETVAAFRSNGTFPDGAVLIKELLEATTQNMTTGEISYAPETEGWFIMIKDTQGRFKDSGLWGDGWGWALFNANDPGAAVTEDYETECLPCHEPAKRDDWVYLRGYPALHGQ